MIDHRQPKLQLWDGILRKERHGENIRVCMGQEPLAQEPIILLQRQNLRCLLSLWLLNSQESVSSLLELSSELLYSEVFSKSSHHKRPKLTSWEKSKRLIHESVTRCVTQCKFTRGTLEIRNSLGNEIRSIYNNNLLMIDCLLLSGLQSISPCGL